MKECMFHMVRLRFLADFNILSWYIISDVMVRCDVNKLYGLSGIHIFDFVLIMVIVMLLTICKI